MANHGSKSSSAGTGPERVLDLARRQGLVRPRDLVDLDIHRMVLTRLTEAGVLVRMGRGVYRLSDAGPMGDPDLALVATKVPQAVIGLVTALVHHGLTTEIPRAVDILLSRKTRQPALDDPPLRVFTAPEGSIREGAVKSKVDGVAVWISGPAKTVADCFKYRSRVGLDVALEALKKGLAQRAFSPATFAKYAKMNRILAFARPYLESMS